jgi:hypothetical protein
MTQLTNKIYHMGFSEDRISLILEWTGKRGKGS